MLPPVKTVQTDLTALTDEALIDLLLLVRSSTPGDDAVHTLMSNSTLVAKGSRLLYLRHERPLSAYLFGLCRNPEIVADVYQETWLKIWKNLDKWQPHARFVTYLYTVARNCLSDMYFRKEQKRLFRESSIELLAEEGIDIPDECPLPDATMHEAQLTAIYQACLDELPVPQKEAYLLSMEQDLTIEAIGSLTGAGKETAKSRIRYAIKKLRQCIGQRGLA